MQPVGVLVRIDQPAAPEFRPGCRAAAAGRCSRCRPGRRSARRSWPSSSAALVEAGSSTWIEAMPDLRRSRGACRARRRGCRGRRRPARCPARASCPRSASAATRSVRSALIVAASALPSRICAVIASSCPSVEEVPGAGEVHGRRPPAWTAAITSASRTDPPGWTIADTPASSRICGPSANGKNASEAATDPAARSPARCTASRQESTRLT